MRRATPVAEPATGARPRTPPANGATASPSPVQVEAADASAAEVEGAVEALIARFREAQTVDPALPLDRAYSLREEATASLALEFAPLGNPAVPAVLLRLQGLRDRPLGKFLLAALAALGGPSAQEALAAQATGAEDFVLRELALRRSVEGWPEVALALLRRVLEEEVDRRVRLVALALSAPLLGAADADWVVALLERDPTGAEEALRVLARADRPGAWAIVRRIMEGPASEALRRAALAVWASERGEAGLDAVGRLFSADEPVEVRMAAVDALLASGTVLALDLLQRIAAYDPEPSVRTRTERAIEALRRRLANPGRTVPLEDPQLTPASLPDRGTDRRPPLVEKPIPR